MSNSSGSCLSLTNSAFATANTCVTNSRRDVWILRSGTSANISARALDFTITTFGFDFGISQIDKDVVERCTRSQRGHQFLRRADLLDATAVNKCNTIAKFF